MTDRTIDIILIIAGILGPILISGIALWVSNRYQKHSKALADDRLLKELFTEFNTRYDKLNNSVDRVSKMSQKEWEGLDKEEKNSLYADIIDYFNICAEEYYWYDQNRINGTIWASWNKGMNDIYNRSEIIQNFWTEECENEGYKSYYIDKPDAFFKKDN